MRRRGRWIRRLVSLFACVALVLAGCGDDTSQPAGAARHANKSRAVPWGKHTACACGEDQRDFRARRPPGRAHRGDRFAAVHGRTRQGSVRHRDECADIGARRRGETYRSTDRRGSSATVSRATKRCVAHQRSLYQDTRSAQGQINRGSLAYRNHHRCTRLPAEARGGGAR